MAHKTRTQTRLKSYTEGPFLKAGGSRCCHHVRFESPKHLNLSQATEEPWLPTELISNCSHNPANPTILPIPPKTPAPPNANLSLSSTQDTWGCSEHLEGSEPPPQAPEPQNIPVKKVSNSSTRVSQF